MRKCSKIWLFLLLGTWGIAMPAESSSGNKKDVQAINETRQHRDVILEGTVKNRNGEPLPGASILVEGTEAGTITDVNGRYFLRFVPKTNQQLVFSYIGYKTKTVVYNGEPVQNVVLEEEAVSLDGVVIIGYGSKERKSLTSSIASVNKKEMERLANTSTTLDNLLGGTMKGVLATPATGEPGAALKVNVRGITSPYPKMGGGTSNVPLYVIDGVPMFMEGNALNPLINIAPGDIESIDVLKDASATAIYGSRGANGVIIVKTKGGHRDEKISVEAGYTFSVSNQSNYYDPLNVTEFKNLQDEILASTVRSMNNGLSQAAYLTDVLQSFGKISQDANGLWAYNGLDDSLYGTANTNWEQEVRNKNAATHQYNVSVRGGSDRANYSFSLNGLNQEGLLINDHLERYGARLSVDTEINSYVSAGGSLGYSYSNRKSGTKQTNEDLFLWYDDHPWQARPDVAVRDEEGNFNWLDATPLYGSSMEAPNPVAKLQRKTEYVNDQFMGNAYIEVSPLKDLKLRADINVTRYAFKSSFFSPKSTLEHALDYMGNVVETPSTLSTSDSHVTTTSINFRADYSLNLKPFHKLDFMAGYGADRYWLDENSMSYSGFPNDNSLTNQGSATNVLGHSDNYSRSGLNSLYGRISYDYNSRYLAEVSMRADASSKFGPGNRWGVFPAISLGWRINNEAFLKDVNQIDDLKLRLSWGKTGSTNISDFAYKQFYKGGFLYGEQSAVQLVAPFPNVDIRWEMTSEFNAGIDFSFFDNRLRGSLDAYYRYTDGALAPAPIGLEYGISTYYGNIIDISNRGVEFAIGGDIIRTRDFTWSMDFNIAANKNRIEDLNGAVISDIYVDNYIEGMPVGTMKGYKVAGIFQTQEQIDELNAGATGNYNIYQQDASPGDYMMVDTDGNGYINDDDRVCIVNPEPKCFGGWTNTFAYKDLSLSFLFQYQAGGEAYYDNLSSDATGMLGQSVLRELYGNTWTPERTNARYAQLVYMPYSYMNSDPNDRYVFKTSYFKLKNITLSYNLPRKWLNQIGVQGASVFATATNLFTVTSWPGLDPEMTGTSAINRGSVNDTYPMARTFSLGLKLKF